MGLLRRKAGLKAVEGNEVAENAAKENGIAKGSNAWLCIHFSKCPGNVIKPSAQQPMQLKWSYSFFVLYHRHASDYFILTMLSEGDLRRGNTGLGKPVVFGIWQIWAALA